MSDPHQRRVLILAAARHLLDWPPGIRGEIAARPPGKKPAGNPVISECDIQCDTKKSLATRACGGHNAHTSLPTIELT
jgi:hypothetical protein